MTPLMLSIKPSSLKAVMFRLTDSGDMPERPEIIILPKSWTTFYQS